MLISKFFNYSYIDVELQIFDNVGGRTKTIGNM